MLYRAGCETTPGSLVLYSATAEQRTRVDSAAVTNAFYLCLSHFNNAKVLKREGEGGGEREGDLTVPLDDGDEGMFGARQAIILGHPESAMNAQGPRGLGTLEREIENRYGY